MTKDEQILILKEALLFYRRCGGTKIVMEDDETKYGLFVENGIVADEALFEAGLSKRRVKKKQMIGGK